MINTYSCEYSLFMFSLISNVLSINIVNAIYYQLEFWKGKLADTFPPLCGCRTFQILDGHCLADRKLCCINHTHSHADSAWQSLRSLAVVAQGPGRRWGSQGRVGGQGLDDIKDMPCTTMLLFMSSGPG